ncbi:MAG TPA: glycosyltransferase [Dyella sp.]|uniref:glycosyltransferase n=1 Tax=Dyella sp. TaxID=1869338 RepID=UPI002D784AC9|nr:glycosyltransferase [Dyella sp.]HET6553514.1 glycosyltransferase [Dyella sp.]
MSVDFTLARMPDGIVIRHSWRNLAWRQSVLDGIVAVPACDEASRIGGCLAALAAQAPSRHGAFGVLVLVNGSTDATLRETMAHGRRESMPMWVVDVDLPRARRDAGASRCLAVRLAMDQLASPHGAIFTTDADSIPPRDWITAYGELLHAGYDAVAGLTTLHADDAEDLPRSLRLREQLERRYESCLDALESWFDPVAHNPWPRHYQASGANLAMKRSCLAALADAPWPVCGEDKAMVKWLEHHDFRVRHDTSRKVLTSGRIFGRAKGGMADTMRRRILDPHALCDDRLEAVDRACFRARARRVFRGWHRLGSPSASQAESFASQLRVPATLVTHALEHAHFGAAWASLEQSSSRLVREALSPGQLAHQCTRGEAMLSRLSLPHLVADAETAQVAP